MIKRLIYKWLFSYTYDMVLLREASSPVKAYKNDAGYDLFVYKSVLIPKHTMVDVSTGVHIKSTGLPAWIYLTGRSSTLMKYGLMVDDGVIDGDYSGEMFIKVYNTTNKDVSLYPGMRIGQMIIIPYTTVKFRQVNKLTIKKGERGSRGFGSTGV